jgi:hypothetical protein
MPTACTAIRDHFAVLRTESGHCHHPNLDTKVACSNPRRGALAGKKASLAATAVGLSTGLPGRTSYVIPSRARHVGTEADWVGGKQLRLAGQLREVAAGRRWNHGCSAVTPAGRAITSRVGWAGDNLVREGLDTFVRVSGWANVRWRTPILRSSPPQAVLFAGLCECHRAAPSGSSGTQDTARDGERLRRRPVICDRPGHEQRLDGGG